MPLEFVGRFNAEERRYAGALTERFSGDEVGATMERVERLTRRASRPDTSRRT